MNPKQRTIVQSILADHSQSPADTSGWHYRPANVALAKYWGKRDADLNLPVASSLSISMGQLGAKTRISPAETDNLTIDGTPTPSESAAARRVFSWLDPFRRKTCPAFAVESHNTVPMAAGLASSASGFAALAAAIDALFGWNLSLREQSILARLGSGSACRSHTPGFVHWHCGNQTDGSDSWGEPLATDWHDVRLAVLALSTAKKAIGSREGMAHTIATSPLYGHWPAQAEADTNAIRSAILDRNFTELGTLAEANAMMMHATMIAARPSLCYWLPESVAAMQKVQHLRQGGMPIYFTMDAGPNLKLLYPESADSAIREQFPDAIFINPFLSCE